MPRSGRFRSIPIILLVFLLVIPANATDSYIQINTIGTHQVGEKITISARTDLSVGDMVFVEIYSTSFSPFQKSQSGEFSGATGTVTVVPGADSTINQIYFDVDFSTFQPDTYQVIAKAVNKDVTCSGLFKVVTTFVLEKPKPSFTYTPHEPVVDQPVYFDASGSTDPDGKIIRYRWDFGDGTHLTDASSSPFITHTYTTTGRCTVGLVVMDNHEQEAWIYEMVSVVPSVPPIADFFLSPSSGFASDDYPFFVMISDMSTGDPATWAWYVDNEWVSQTRTFAQVRFTKPGTHTVRLEVSNNYGSSIAEKQVTVHPFAATSTPVTIITTTPLTTAPTVLSITVTPIPTPTSPCRIFTVPCEWIGFAFIAIFVIVVIVKIIADDLTHKIQPPEITVVTRGGVKQMKVEPKNLEIHVNVEAGIDHPDMVDEEGD